MTFSGPLALGCTVLDVTGLDGTRLEICASAGAEEARPPCPPPHPLLLPASRRPGCALA
ncbi:hypothetical protein ABZ705_25475 [Streptomyces sp. NPDC006984]|uniref:hypothetical protein n=1 Tax=Streptomyces sp. NPDC006984 TaxID=3155463 RepID=UPI0033F9B024